MITKVPFPSASGLRAAWYKLQDALFKRLTEATGGILANGEGEALDRGTVIAASPVAGNTGIRATEARGMVGILLSDAPPSGALELQAQGTTTVKLETGLTPINGQTLYLGATAGKATTAAGPSAIATIVATDNYATNETVEATLFGPVAGVVA